MPTYDYECKKCSHKFEVFQSMSDEQLKICPECGGELRRLIGGGLGVIFKGSGFYVNDSKGKNSTISKPTASKTEDKSVKTDKSVSLETKKDKKEKRVPVTSGASSSSASLGSKSKD